MWVLCLHVCMFTWWLEIRRGHWISWDWSHTIVNHHVGAGYRIWVLCKSSRCWAISLAFLLTLTQPYFLEFAKLLCGRSWNRVGSCRKGKWQLQNHFEQWAIYLCGSLGAVNVLEKLSSDLSLEKELGAQRTQLYTLGQRWVAFLKSQASPLHVQVPVCALELSLGSCGGVCRGCSEVSWKAIHSAPASLSGMNPSHCEELGVLGSVQR